MFSSVRWELQLRPGMEITFAEDLNNMSRAKAWQRTLTVYAYDHDVSIFTGLCACLGSCFWTSTR